MRNVRGAIKQRINVDVTTIDNYCRDYGIERIDILKSDTQGFDLEVLKGASRLLDQHRIHLVYVEIVFGKLYHKKFR